MTLEEICKEGVIQPYGLILKYKLLDDLISKTSFLDEKEITDYYGKITNSQRMWHIRFGIFDVQYCIHCGKPMIWSKSHQKHVVHKECFGKETSLVLSKMTKEKIDNSTKKRKKTNIERYGSEFASQTKEIKEKAKQTCVERYGVENSMKTEEFKTKVRNTCMERYGVENYSKTEEFKESYKDTCVERYGVDNVSKLQETKEKAKITNIKKYNKDHYSKTEEFKESHRNTCMERYGVMNYFSSKEFLEKAKQTNLEKYGEDHYSKTEEFKKREKITNLKKYGVENYSKTEEFLEKAKQTNLEKYNVEWHQQSDEQKEIQQLNVEVKFKKFLLSFGIQDITYVKNLHGGEHELCCSKCNNNFIVNSKGFYYNRTRNKQELCTICNPLQKGYSCGEKEVVDFVKSIYVGDIVENTKSIISPYELDIYLPELNLAIEYNGLYWHSSEQKDKDYHKMKSDLCKEKGIHLVHIFEDSWSYKQEIVKSVLSNFISNENNKSLQARKCEIKKVSFYDTNEFLVDNHLLGSIVNFSACYGLYNGEELVSLMSFRLISKNTMEYELNRYAIKSHYKITGGAERLLSAFMKDYKEICTSIITYNDNSVFKGKIYEKLGFTYIKSNSPNYMFIKKDDNYSHRFPKQSIRALKVGFSLEIEEKLGYLRVYNSGNDVYKKPINQ